MKFQECSDRAFPKSPSLIALSYLEPPSPVLYPSDALQAATSGEIPIFFDSGLPLPLDDNDDDDDMLVNTRFSFQSSMNRRSSVPTLNTAGSIGTFGPKGHVDFGIRFSQLSHIVHQSDEDARFSLRGPSFATDQEVLEEFAFETMVADDGGQEALHATTESWISDLAFPRQLKRADSATSSVSSPSSRNGPLTEQEFMDILAAYDNSYAVYLTESEEHDPSQDTTGALLHTIDMEDLPEALESSRDHTPPVNCLDAKPPTRRDAVSHGTQHANVEVPVPAWLREAIVELHIDQEGFRSIQPTCHFTEVYERGVTAVFTPPMEQAFNFHHGPFDSSPVLHRLVVNGRESMDYISRQASLCLKTNGIYTVRGTESSCSTLHRTGHDEALSWKFDYLVGDRRLNSGKVVGGEKTLTPLRFSCSPLLLHPLQGKRIRFIHIVKKNVTAKLVAEKVEPFATVTPSKIPLSPQTNYLEKMWPLHRRVKSHAPTGGPTHRLPSNTTGTAQGNPATQEKNIGPYHGAKPKIHRRRASSAGEWKGTESRLTRPQHGTERRPDRHILSPSSLARLLEEYDKEEDKEYLAIPATGLSPAPRTDTRRHH
ncbi:hypothetical protein BDN72DRAFT_953838 [Pluteus cervinus]|uniref:Uncharacterized protein n=1 Tax=Pluteus cervinus TaxID=181527 RepID=A0ACD3BH01_9AGAR|nr:hypothetical protein BDN72DRAFT_953838 [Pluteus cervinus]